MGAASLDQIEIALNGGAHEPSMVDGRENKQMEIGDPLIHGCSMQDL
jgi:hypothetical protein